MASNADFVQYIVDQCSGAGEIAGLTFRDAVDAYPHLGHSNI